MFFPGQEVPLEWAGETYTEKGVTRAAVHGGATEDPTRTKTVVIPRVGQVVLGRVTKISFNKVQVDILCVEEIPLEERFLAVVRLSEIRRHEIEKLKVEECFQPGDIVKARVISLGDSKFFYLSTAEADLGVVIGWDQQGNKLLPCSWEELIEPNSGTTYKRKVAKPIVMHES